jgi:hypothetical protein
VVKGGRLYIVGGDLRLVGWWVALSCSVRRRL